jgi:hypothetical protein
MVRESAGMARRLVSAGIRWICGLLVLLAVDLFAELYVFEWLEWNGTDKNDWFFMLWWVLVLCWVISCGVRVLRPPQRLDYSPEAE